MVKLQDMTTSNTELFKADPVLQDMTTSNTELFKADPVLAATILQPLFAAIWEGGEVPADRTKGVIIRITKKGALSYCNNWCSITLLSIPSKIRAKMIVKRISDSDDAGMRKEQVGFRKEWGCTDQIFTLHNIIEQCTEWQRQLYISVLFTFRKPLTASTEIVYDTF